MPSQWETSLQSNAVSRWLGPNLESAKSFPSGYPMSHTLPAAPHWRPGLRTADQSPTPGPRITDLVASQLANGSAAFIWKLHCHWLRGLRQCQIVVIQTPGDPSLVLEIWAPHLKTWDLPFTAKQRRSCPRDQLEAARRRWTASSPWGRSNEHTRHWDAHGPWRNIGTYHHVTET